MKDDDAIVGHVLTRRQALRLIGATGGLLLVGRSRAEPSAGPAPACVVRPEQTEGPYFVDERLNRSDIRSDPSDGSFRPGARLDLALKVSRMGPGGCAPRPPYASKGRRNQRNAGDGIFRHGGSQLLLSPVETSSGYDAAFGIALEGV